jgi:hypothetical protein
MLRIDQDIRLEPGRDRWHEEERGDFSHPSAARLVVAPRRFQMVAHVDYPAIVFTDLPFPLPLEMIVQSSDSIMVGKAGPRLTDLHDVVDPAASPCFKGRVTSYLVG